MGLDTPSTPSQIPGQLFLKNTRQACPEKGLENEFNLYAKIEELAPHVIAQCTNSNKAVSANVDFYSGFVYRMLNLPLEMFTPIFALARISGWSAHRIEEIVNAGKIIRPAYKNVERRKKYVSPQ